MAEKRKNVAYEYLKNLPYAGMFSTRIRNGTNPMHAKTPSGKGGNDNPSNSAVDADRPIKNFFD